VRIIRYGPTPYGVGTFCHLGWMGVQQWIVKRMVRKFLEQWLLARKFLEQWSGGILLRAGIEQQQRLRVLLCPGVQQQQQQRLLACKLIQQRIVVKWVVRKLLEQRLLACE